MRLDKKARLRIVIGVLAFSTSGFAATLAVVPGWDGRGDKTARRDGFMHDS